MSENHVARGIDNSRNAGERNAQQQQDVASSGTRRQEEEQDSDDEGWIEDRWGGYDDWDQDDEGDSFWWVVARHWLFLWKVALTGDSRRRIDAPR